MCVDGHALVLLWPHEMASVKPLALPWQQPPHQHATEAIMVKPLSGICFFMWHTLVVCIDNNDQLSVQSTATMLD